MLDKRGGTRGEEQEEKHCWALTFCGKVSPPAIPVGLSLQVHGNGIAAQQPDSDDILHASKRALHLWESREWMLADKHA